MYKWTLARWVRRTRKYLSQGPLPGFHGRWQLYCYRWFLFSWPYTFFCTSGVSLNEKTSMRTVELMYLLCFSVNIALDNPELTSNAGAFSCIFLHTSSWKMFHKWKSDNGTKCTTLLVLTTYAAPSNWPFKLSCGWYFLALLTPKHSRWKESSKKEQLTSIYAVKTQICTENQAVCQRSHIRKMLELWYNTLDILCTNGHFISILLISRDRIEIT